MVENLVAKPFQGKLFLKFKKKSLGKFTIVVGAAQVMRLKRCQCTSKDC